MSGSLYDLVGEYKELYAMLTDTDDDDREVVETSLESVQFEIETKAEGYLKIMEKLDMELEAAEKQKDYWTRAVASRKNAKEWMRQHIMNAMLMMGVDEIDAGGKKFKMTKVGGVLPLIIDENMIIPEKYTKITIEPDKKLIREALDKGEKLDFAHFGERAKTVKVK